MNPKGFSSLFDIVESGYTILVVNYEYFIRKIFAINS